MQHKYMITYKNATGKQVKEFVRGMSPADAAGKVKGTNIIEVNELYNPLPDGGEAFDEYLDMYHRDKYPEDFNSDGNLNRQGFEHARECWLTEMDVSMLSYQGATVNWSKMRIDAIITGLTRVVRERGDCKLVVMTGCLRWVEFNTDSGDNDNPSILTWDYEDAGVRNKLIGIINAPINAVSKE